MADVDTVMLASQHADIIKEGLKESYASLAAIKDSNSEIIKEGLKENYNTLNAVKDSRYETVSRIESNADRVEGAVNSTKDQLLARTWELGRDSSDLRAQVTNLGTFVRDASVMIAKDTENSVLKNTIEAQKNTQFLAEKISADGEKTRLLITDLKNQDLNRMLIERNAEIVDERHHARHWRSHYDQAQFAALQSQFQAFGSQLSDARNSMVNFGTQLGVGQRSTSNNVN